MPVTVFLGSSSNKQGIGESNDSKNQNGDKGNKVGKDKKYPVDAKKVAYFPTYGAAVLKPVLDKLALIYKLPDDPDLKGALKESLLSAPEDEPQYFKAAEQWTSGTVTYHASTTLTEPSSGASILIQFGPKKPTTQHDLRLEFNPEKLGSVGLDFLKLKLEQLVPNGLKFHHIITDGTVTRADIAVDLLGVGMDELILRFSGSGKSHWYYSAKQVPETAYLGLKETNCPWLVYDKRQQLIDNEQEPPYGELAHTRVEFKAKPNKPFAKLQHHKNPFDRISLALPTRPAGVEPHLWTWFLDSCRWAGEQKALMHAPPTQVPILKQALDAAHDKFWNPAKIWDVWTSAFAGATTPIH